MAKRKKAERLGLESALTRLDRMIELIKVDVEVGLGVEAALETANNLVMSDRLRGVQFHGADCYNAVSQSMGLFLAITLAKLFEIPTLRGLSKATRYNRSDVASIPLMIRLLNQKRIRRRLRGRAMEWTPAAKYMSNKNADACSRAIDRSVEAYRALRRQHAGRSAVAKLKKFRDKVLAHSLMGEALKARPIYRELFLLMDVARDVTQHARLAISGIHVDLKETEEILVDTSQAFWKPALYAAVKANGRSGGAASRRRAART